MSKLPTVKEAREFVKDSFHNLPMNQKSYGALGSIGWFVAGAAAGAAVMYLLDPVQGGQRRTDLRRRGSDLTSDAGEKLSGLAAQAKRVIAKVSNAIPVGRLGKEAHAKAEEAADYLH